MATSSLEHATHKSPISALSREILQSIFEYIYYTSPSTLSSLTHVNRVFYAAVYSFRHRDQVFTFKEDMRDRRSIRSLEIIDSLLTDPAKKHIALSIRSITVISVPKPHNWRTSAAFIPPDRQAHEKKWLKVAELLAETPHIRTFTLRGTDQLSVALLNTLEKYHATAHLHIQNWRGLEQDEDEDEDRNIAAELALAKSPNLRSLSARFLQPTSGRGLRQAALKRIVALSPNLQEVDISEYGDSLRHLIIGLEEQEELMKLEAQFLNGLTASANSIKSLRFRRLEYMTILGNVTDLSKLESLGVGYVDNTDEDILPAWHGDKLPCLKHFSFSLPDLGREGEPDVDLSTYSPLISLGIHDGASRISPSVISSSHGHTLRNLVLHNREQPNPEAERVTISLRELQTLSMNCKVLEDLTVDADRTSAGDGFNEILSALATFPLLQKIRFYLPLGIAEEAARTPHIFLDEEETRLEIEVHRKNPFNPIEDSCWIENAWSLLRHEKKKNGSKPLKQLHIKVGEWEREVGSGYPAGWVVWEAANRRYFISTPHERDDRPDDINLYIRGSKPYSQVDSHEIRHVPEFVDLWDCG